MPAPLFFQPVDLLAFQRRLQTNPHYNATNPADKRYAEQLKAGVFEKTAYWGQQVERRLSPGRYEYVMRQTWTQGTHFRKYSWARFFLLGTPDKAFYFTLGIDSGETDDARRLAAEELAPPGPALIVKLDGHFASDGTLTTAQYAAGEALRQTLPLAARWWRIGPEQLHDYDWSRLLTETMRFVQQYEGDLLRIMEATRQ
ncbi:hypothetical protein [Hymenobacter glacieicola]|uniref:Uncharacterized protein n=1 Tax=Hymenobacter glacieicola TaxID=1562124 RepID=A0ABQ1WNZ8_9BACT|nr:hypothetical protein [Hymenobacter glacieicola]GGG35503.1 hypothetical protein GCM10011378_09710 [Hymenobacter glacieicola]